MSNGTRFLKPTLVALTVASLAAFMLGGPVHAATRSANLSVSASVAANCTITTTPLNFGGYDPVEANSATPLDGTGAVNIACTKGSVTPISLDLGLNASGTTRRMTDGSGAYLQYELYSDSGRTTVWGDGGPGHGAKYTPAAAPSKAQRSFTVYGRVPADQDVAAGSYGDTVQATVEF
jgi:spore coat protein U-like protein